MKPSFTFPQTMTEGFKAAWSDPKIYESVFYTSTSEATMEWTPEQKAPCKECERLMKIIQKELCENDDLGCEYSYIIAVKMKVRDLETLIDDLKGDVEFLQDENKSLFLELEDLKRRESTFLK